MKALIEARNALSGRAQQITDTIETAEPLVDRGFVSKLQYQSWRDSLLQVMAQVAQTDEQLVQLRTLQVQAHLERATIAADLAQQKAALSQAIAALDQRLAQAAESHGVVQRSMLDGRVSAIRVNEGAAVQVGSDLATVIPTNARLEAELWLPPRAVGFVRPGQEVRIAYVAFPESIYGSVHARLSELSGASVAYAAPNTSVDAPAFIARAQLPSQTIHARGADWPLSAGMRVTGRIVVEQQSLLQWAVAIARPSR
jgi:membrane fusion protein